MGYSHSWTLSRDLTPQQWRRITIGAQALAEAMPGELSRGMFVEGYRPTLAQRALNVLWKRNNTPPFTLVAGSTGVLNAQGDTLQVAPGRPNVVADTFSLPNTTHVGYCKTNAEFYDRLVSGILVLTEQVAPECFAITETDMEDDHRQRLEQWVQRVCAHKSMQMPASTPALTGASAGGKEAAPPKSRRPRS